MMFMFGYQEQRMLMVGDGNGGGRMEQDGVRFNRAIQNNVQFKTYKLFISGTFYLIFSYRS